jgi:two-component system, cell cycle sensor histidine kinase and response regulator CckA
MQLTQFDISLLDAVAGPSIILDSAWRYVHLNPEAVCLSRRPLEALVGQLFWDAYPELIGTETERVYREAMHSRRRVTREVLGVDGSWYRITASPFMDGLFIQHLDITSHVVDAKERASRASESELALQAVIRATPLAIETVDIEGRVRMWNPAAETMFGWTADQVIGARHPTTPSDLSDEHLALFAAECEGLEVSALETRRRRKDGTLLDVIVSSAPLRDATGEIRGVVSVVSDVTERKRLEMQLLQAQKMEAVGRLAGGVAHDFNNLLTAISAYSELLLASLDDDDPRCTEAREIRAAAQRGAGLTRQLLSFSRKQVVQPQVVTTDVVMGSLANLLRRLIGEDVELALRPLAEDACVRVDPGQLEQAVVNLVVNARDAMPHGGRVTLETRSVRVASPIIHPNGFVRPGSWVVISVIDTGSGMTPDVLSHLFEPFFTTKPPGKGTGLGLSTVYGIVKQSGGHVLVESTPGSGSAFHIYLPCVNEPAAARPAVAASDSPGGAESVLLVEDEEAVRRALLRILEAAGYRVLCASNGAEALEMAQSHEGAIDLLITDVIMPQMGGRELVERLTARHRGLRALYISGYTGDVGHDRSALGPHAYLQKPFTTEGILSKVREVLESRRPGAGGRGPGAAS